MAFDAPSRTPKLTTVQNVGIEISRIYRATKRGRNQHARRLPHGADARGAEDLS